MNYQLSVPASPAGGMSAKGSVVARASVNNVSSYQWDLKSLSKGVYYLTVISHNKKATVKFVKE